MKIKDQTLEKFLDSVASKTPTPGGGAVAAVTGAMAASLVEMVCNLTIGKKRYPEVQDEMIRVAERASELSFMAAHTRAGRAGVPAQSSTLPRQIE